MGKKVQEWANTLERYKSFLDSPQAIVDEVGVGWVIPPTLIPFFLWSRLESPFLHNLTKLSWGQKLNNDLTLPLSQFHINF